MRGQDEDARVRVTLDECAARVTRLRRVVAEAARPLRLGDLHRAVHEIPGENGLPGGRPESDRDVARGVAGRRLEAKPLVHDVVGVHEDRLTRLDDRHHAVGDALVLLVAPELPLFTAKTYPPFRNVGNPTAPHRPRLP